MAFVVSRGSCFAGAVFWLLAWSVHGWAASGERASEPVSASSAADDPQLRMDSSLSRQIATVRILGVNEVPAADVRKALRGAGLFEGGSFSASLGMNARHAVQELYARNSFYSAIVDLETLDVSLGKVVVHVKIQEGARTQVARVTFAGNSVFSESELQKVIGKGARADGPEGGATNGAGFSAEQAEQWVADFYRSSGYLEFRVMGRKLIRPKDEETAALQLTLWEGRRYRLLGLALEGDYLGHNKQFMSLVAAKVGGAYDGEDMKLTLDRFSELFGRMGYAFAKVDVISKPNLERASMDVVLRATPNGRVKVRGIRVEGNERTREEVILREMRQEPASWFDAQLVRASQERVAGLGFFSSVEMEARPVSGSPELVDLVVAVVERPTGQLNFGVGYSQADKASVYLNARQDSVFGTGHRLSFDVYSSAYTQRVSLSTTDPYFTARGMSRTFDVYYRSTEPYEGQGGSYKVTAPGLGVRFGLPVSKFDALFWGLRAERIGIKDGGGLPEAYVGQEGTYLPLTFGWVRDQRDSVLAPTTGSLYRIESELGVGSERRYAKLQLQNQHYFPLTSYLTLAFNASLGVGKGLGGQAFPVMRNFYGGGLGSVRGFEQGTLGPTSKIKDSVVEQRVNIGGARSLGLNVELIAPFPGASDEKTLRWFTFFDAGNVYGEDERIGSDLRTSAGIGLSWNSPVGPLRFAYSRAIKKTDTDKTQRVQFQVGTSF